MGCSEVSEATLTEASVDSSGVAAGDAWDSDNVVKLFRVKIGNPLFSLFIASKGRKLVVLRLNSALYGWQTPLKLLFYTVILPNVRYTSRSNRFQRFQGIALE
jgi:hypothetical protein